MKAKTADICTNTDHIGCSLSAKYSIDRKRLILNKVNVDLLSASALVALWGEQGAPHSYSNVNTACVQ